MKAGEGIRTLDVQLGNRPGAVPNDCDRQHLEVGAGAVCPPVCLDNPEQARELREVAASWVALPAHVRQSILVAIRLATGQEVKASK